MTRIAFAFAFMTLLAPVVAAQTLDEIVVKHIEARGGLEKLKSVSTMRMTGKMQMGPMEAPFVMTNARPNRTRVEFTVQGMTGVQAFDGKTAWAIMPFTGKKDPEAMSEESSKDIGESADFDGPLVGWKEKGHKAELVGKEKLEGTDAYKIKITLKSGHVRTTWIDAETFLELATEGKRKMRGAEVDFKNAMSDYKEVDGMVVAHAWEATFTGAAGQHGAGQQKQAMTIEKVELNVAAADSLFDVPKNAKPAAADSAAMKKADEKKADVKKSDDKKPGDKKP